MGEFIYCVTDDSMSADNIFFGDVIRIRSTQKISSDDIVAIACLDDVSKLTLRRVKRQGYGYILTPSNPDMKSDLHQDALVVGIVTQIRVTT